MLLDYSHVLCLKHKTSISLGTGQMRVVHFLMDHSLLPALNNSKDC